MKGFDRKQMRLKNHSESLKNKQKILVWQSRILKNSKQESTKKQQPYNKMKTAHHKNGITNNKVTNRAK